MRGHSYDTHPDSLRQHCDGRGLHTQRQPPPDPAVVEGVSIQQCAVTSPPDPAVVKGVSIQQRAVISIITVCGVITQAQSWARKTSMISLFVCQVIETNIHDSVW
ncbi:uncharacterized protein LOC119348693 [Triticum dicoccoides]|uniref:uncharacterized protein LOC119348693 n=1 Tax=Triticum dicoccoides TaxID=85692 RepID=UPI00188E0215|nr:uncharacterized protein LOC119348693 [Triticum dicoccoides]